MADKGHQEIFAAAFGPWGQIGAAWAETMSGLGSEVIRFLAARVEADVDLQHRLLNAKSLDEVSHIHAEFVQKAIDQYAAETGRMVELGEEMSRQLGIKPAT